MRVTADDKLHIIFGGDPDLLDGQMPMFVIDLNQRTRICAGFDNVLNVKRTFIARMRQNIDMVSCFFVGV